MAAAISLTLASAQLQAQETSKLEEVIVTGSFIRGTPEDSAMPVEVVSFEEIENMGRPSNLDLIKTMSESAPVSLSALLRGSSSLGTLYVNNGFRSIPSSSDSS